MTFVAFWLTLLPVSASFLLRHHVYKKTDHRNVELTEVGPRFELKCEFGPLVYAGGGGLEEGLGCAWDDVSFP